jgi:hypothetical protein
MIRLCNWEMRRVPCNEEKEEDEWHVMRREESKRDGEELLMLETEERESVQEGIQTCCPCVGYCLSPMCTVKLR